MIVPAHWSEATVAADVDGRRVRIKRFGWSDVDTAAAQRMANERAAEALARLQRGEQAEPREPKVPYNGAEGVPIREEIVRRVGDTVITRNSYGALCLNTPDVLFADVDFEEPLPAWGGCLLALSLALVSGAALGELWGVFGWMAGVVVGLLVTPFVARSLALLWRVLSGGPERVALRRVERFAATIVGGRVELYRTPAGLRVLVAHTTYDPAGPEAAAVFSALHADRTYVAMCERQRCFRARVTAKPWRIGIMDHMRPRPGVWPVHPERLGIRRRWLKHYDQKAVSFAACRHERTLGVGAEDPRVAPVRALHDELSRARTGLPIA